MSNEQVPSKELDTPWFRRLMADYERLAAPSNDIPLPLPVELWVQERLRTSLDQVRQRSGSDREGWIEDARYWRMIVERFIQPAHEPADGLPHYTCPNCETRDEFSVRHDTVEDRRPGVTGYPVVPVVKCNACGQEARATLRGDESRIDLPPDDGRPSQPPGDWQAVMLTKPTKADGDVVLVFTGEAYSVEYPEDVNGAEHIAWCRITPYSRPTKCEGRE